MFTFRNRNDRTCCGRDQEVADGELENERILASLACRAGCPTRSAAGRCGENQRKPKPTLLRRPEVSDSAARKHGSNLIEIEEFLRWRPEQYRSSRLYALPMSKKTTPEMPTFLNSGNSTSLFQMICMLPPSGRLPRAWPTSPGGCVRSLRAERAAARSRGCRRCRRRGSAREIGHAERIGRRRDAELGVDLEDERSPERPVVAREAAPADELVLRAGVLARVLGEHRVVPAAGREQAVVARVPRQRARARDEVTPPRNRFATEVDSIGALVAPRFAMPPEPRRDADVLELVGEERACARTDERVAPRQRATRCVAVERAEAAALVVEVERERPLRVEEVRLEEAQRGTAGGASEICACSASVWPRPNRLFCGICACAMKFSTRREAGADLERAGRALGDLDVDVDELVGAAALGRDVDVLEEAERHDAALADLEVRLVEELALGDLHLAADDLVARLRVAADVDALEVGALAARRPRTSG